MWHLFYPLQLFAAKGEHNIKSQKDVYKKKDFLVSKKLYPQNNNKINKDMHLCNSNYKPLADSIKELRNNFKHF